MRYINVSIPKSTLRALTYSVPENYPAPKAGMRVLIPLGSRFVSGFVVETDISPDQERRIKSISDVLDSEMLFSSTLLKLTKWMSEYYLADWADILKAALPPGIDVRAGSLVSITLKGESAAIEDPILQILNEKKTLPLKKLYSLFGHRGTYSKLKVLQGKGLLEITAAKQKRRSGYNMVEVIRSSEPPTAKKEKELYNYLSEQPSALWMQEIRTRFKSAAALIRKMSQHGQVRCFWLPASTFTRWPQLTPVKDLNPAQQQAYDTIKKQSSTFSIFLLHGITGSGKTEIYLRLAKNILSKKKSVLILVPEIALLPMIVQRAQQMLKTPISILHSELGERERLEEWNRVKSGKVRVAIGTRSALFAPLSDLGLIVIDEEQDGSYKQGEYPRYHARESAIMRAKFEGCPIVLGSATPSIESFYNAGNGKYNYLSLPQRIEQRNLPKIHLIDMKMEYRQTGDPVFSRLLLTEVEKTLARKQQVLILLNRRGYAALLMCRECGSLLECPNCAVTLTYHKYARRMRCHHCDYARLVPSNCDKCGSSIMHLFGVGTEKLLEALRKRYPDASIERLDRDTTTRKGSLTGILGRFAAREIDVLVGTQMLAKGHDFPAVTLVGIVGADSAIGIPDFRSSEKLFQLITQVAGRSGRGEEPGTVILQTFHPHHYAIECSLKQNYAEFYEKEIHFRRLTQYPPYVAIANIILSGKEAKKVLEEARQFAKFVLAFKTENMKLLGPAIAPLSRLSGLYRFQLLIKSPERRSLRECIHAARSQFDQDGKHYSLLSIDIDPHSIA